MTIRDMNTCSSLIRRLQDKLQELKKYRKMFPWRFFQGEPPRAFEAEFNDSSWEETSLPMTLDVRKSGGWLRCRVKVPVEINGISTVGSQVKFFSSPILGRTEIFVNSRRVLSADYWAELRGPKIILTTNAQPNEEYVIAVHVHKKYEPVEIPAFEVRFGKVEDVIFEVESFIQELRLVKMLDPEKFNRVSRDFNWEVIDGEISLLMREINRARAQMSELSGKIKQFKVHLVAHAHIDMNWLWPWEDTIRTVGDTFNTMLRFMKDYPRFCFSQSQAATYKIVEENFPYMFKSIREYAESGRWDITASMWVESDLNMAGTEALVRQFLEAKDYIWEKFRFEPRVCWEPDTFGHIWTLPQILRKSGCKYYYFMRCGKGDRIFWWEAPDGSRVLAYTSIYNNFVTPKNIVDLVIELYEKYGLKTSMFVYGVGDHGGGATVEDIEAALKMQRNRLLPDIFFSTTHRFFDEASEELNGKKIPVINDELQFIFDGCYTTHGDIKRYNRVCERLLVDAEKFSVFSGKYPRTRLKKAWRNMLFNQFHDILDGSGASEAYTYPRRLAEEAMHIAREILYSSIQEIAKQIRFSRSETAVVVFNPLSWRRIDVVEVKIPKEKIPRRPVLVSSDGREKAEAQFDGEKLIFIAKVPSMGYKTYYLVEGEKERGEDSIKCGDYMIENEFFRLEVDHESGAIASLLDKIENRLVFKKHRFSYTKHVLSNLLQVLYEIPHRASAWVIGEISRVDNLVKGASVKLVEKGSVKAALMVEHKIRDSRITQYISLYRGIPRIDFDTVIDWREISDGSEDAPMLKASFTPILGASKVTYEIPFGYIERVADGTEVPALRWVDISDGEYGVSLLNDCKHGFDAKGNTIRITLIRTSYSPDPRPDFGIHNMKYSLYPHRGDWRKALTFRRGYEINHPLEAVVIADPSATDGFRPEECSFLEITPANVVVSGIKTAEGSRGFIIRIYDATGEGAKAELMGKFKIRRAYETDLLEREIKPLRVEGGKIMVDLSPFEIKTIRIEGKLS